MRVLENLQPKAVFRYFEDLCQIPHSSFHTKAISDYCVEFAKSHGFRCHQDAANNVVIYKSASPGCEKAPTVILQGHLDMVAEKAADSPIDFLTDPLDLATDGRRVWANGTTLGGDDGIAAAMTLAVLDSTDLPHPALEAVFTTDEEVGMLGAEALDPALLKGRRMLNLDSDAEGILTVSCAGGAAGICTIPLQREPFSAERFVLKVEGLAGGHSGVEIHKERGNSNLLMGRVLLAMQKKLSFRLIHVEGGLKDNAIPLYTEAVLAMQEASVCTAEAVIREMEAAFRAEFAVSDPGVHICLQRDGCSEQAMTADSTERVVEYLSLVPNGIFAMSMDIPGLVQTSCNLGILKTDDAALHATVSARSSVVSQKEMILRRLEVLCHMLGGNFSVVGAYSGWEYRRDSALRDLMVQTYEDLTGKKPEVVATHAGLECGLFAGKLPGLDAVSFGPDLYDIHTSREQLSVSSVENTWKYLCEVLRRLTAC